MPNFNSIDNNDKVTDTLNTLLNSKSNPKEQSNLDEQTSGQEG